MMLSWLCIGEGGQKWQLANNSRIVFAILVWLRNLYFMEGEVHSAALIRVISRLEVMEGQPQTLRHN
jgi:hypothetical protein